MPSMHGRLVPIEPGVAPAEAIGSGAGKHPQKPLVASAVGPALSGGAHVPPPPVSPLTVTYASMDPKVPENSLPHLKIEGEPNLLCGVRVNFLLPVLYFQRHT